MNAPVLLPKGTHFARLAMALAQGRDGVGAAKQYAESKWGPSSIPAMILRAAVVAGNTTDPNWASPLAPYAVAAAEFVEALRPRTLLGKMQGMRRAPLLTRIPRATAGSIVGWVGQGGVTPVSRMSLDTVSLEALKISGLVVATMELARMSSPSAEGLIRSDLLAATAYFSDRSFIDPAAAGVPGVSPASITNDAPSVASTGTTAAAAKQDLKNLFKLVTDAGIELESPYLITDRRTAINLALMDDGNGAAFPGVTVQGGELAGVPLLTTAAVPTSVSGDSPPGYTSTITLVDAAEIIIGDENEARVDMSEAGTVQMDSAPDSPVTASTVSVSLWQQNLTAWRVVRLINWQLRRPGAVAVLTDVNY